MDTAPAGPVTRGRHPGSTKLHLASIAVLVFGALAVTGWSPGPLAAAEPAPARAGAPEPLAWAVPETRDHPLAGTVWDKATGTRITEAAAFDRLVQAPIPLLGEIHDNPAAHDLQARALRALVGAGRRPAVVWEMVRSDRQPVLDAPPGDTASLGAALDWATSGWPEWALYAPIAEVALAHDLPLVAGDLPRADLRAVAEQGLSALAAPVAAVADVPLSEAQRAGLLEALRVGHCDLLPAAALEPMLPVQQARDAAMAAAVLAGGRASADGAVLIAGNGHTRRDWGVPHYVTAAGVADLAILSVGVVEVIPGEDTPDAYAVRDDGGTPLYDLVWYVPRVDRPDPCAQLRDRFGGGAPE